MRPGIDKIIDMIKEGAWAGMVVVEGHPLQNLDLDAGSGKKFVLIMKDGSIYNSTLE